MAERVELGDRVKDRVTGFRGICIARTSHLAGCDTVGVKTEALEPGKPIPDAEWFDITQIEVLDKAIVALFKDELEAEDDPGGPKENQKI